MNDSIALFRTAGALLVVLGLLAGALWAARRYNLAPPGIGRSERHLAVVERLNLDPRRSLALLRYDGVEHLLLLAPEGHLVIETRPVDASATVTAPSVVVPAARRVAPPYAVAWGARLADGLGAVARRLRPPVSSPATTAGRARATRRRRRVKRNA